MRTTEMKDFDTVTATQQTKVKPKLDNYSKFGVMTGVAPLKSTPPNKPSLKVGIYVEGFSWTSWIHIG